MHVENATAAFEFFEVIGCYSDLKAVGSGAFGFVCSANDRQSHQMVAIKKVFKPFSNITLVKRTYRELILLKYLKHENLIGLKDLYKSSSDDIYFVTDFMDTNLANVLASKKLDNSVTKYFLYQLLKGIYYIHSRGIIHRDLKPSNILINERCDLKICDFGLARTTEPEMTGYVSTRYYRAPEIMLNWQSYDKSVDIWSAGCILAEMMKGFILFPGRDHVEQFDMITTLLGSPSQAVIDRICTINTKRYAESLPQRLPIDLCLVFQGCDPHGIDLLKRMLVIDSRERISAAAALQHPFLADFFETEDLVQVDGEDIELMYSFLDEKALTIRDMKVIIDELLVEVQESKRSKDKVLNM